MTVLPTTITPQRPLYPIGIPAKFSPEGFVQRFPGNTTLCHVPLIRLFCPAWEPFTLLSALIQFFRSESISCPQHHGT